MEAEGSENLETTQDSEDTQKVPEEKDKEDVTKETDNNKKQEVKPSKGQGDSKLEMKQEIFDPETVKNLSKGILEAYEPPLATINTHLRELTEKQEAVHNMLTSERRKLEDTQNDVMLDAMLADIATNKEKLASIQSSMMNLHKRVQALQVRAANVEKAAKVKAAKSEKSANNSI